MRCVLPIDVLEDDNADTEICCSGITVTGAYSATSRPPAPASQPTKSTVYATPKPTLTASPTRSQANPTAQEDDHTQRLPESAIETSHSVLDVPDHAHSGIASNEEKTKIKGTNTPANSPVLTSGGSRYTRSSQSEIVLPGLTMKPGQAATLSNIPISLDPAGSYAIVDTKTQSLAFEVAADASKVPAVLTVGEVIYTAEQNNNVFVINGMTLHRGGTVTVAETLVALGPNGDYAVVGTSTQRLVVASSNVNSAPIINVAGTPYTQRPDSGDYIIADQTLSKGGMITIADTVVSLNPDSKSAAAGFSVEHFITAAPVAGVQPEPVLTFGGSTYTARPGSHDFVIDGQTLTQGGEIAVSGVVISYPSSSYIVVGSSTQRLEAARTAELTFDGSTFTADAHGDFIVDGQTLTPGGVITVDGTAISYAADGAEAVVGSETQYLATNTDHGDTITFEGSITFESSTHTANAASDFVIAGQILKPGSVITVDGTAISYVAAGAEVVVGSETQYLATNADHGVIITFEGSMYTANAAGDFVIAGQILKPGSVITVDDTAISYAVDDVDTVVGSETQYLATNADHEVTITFGGSTYTANAAGDFVIASQTLTPGKAITIDGTPISYAADESDVVVGISTKDVGLGSYIMGGFGDGFGTATAGGSNYTGVVFSSWAGGRCDSLLSGRWAVVVGTVVIVSMM